MGTYAYSGNQNKQRDNHADEYLPDLLNDIQDEIEIVEQVLSGGEEGQVLTADSAGKAQWAAGGGGGGGVIYDGIEETHEWDGDEGAYKINLTLTLNGEPINKDSFVMYKVSNTQLDFSSSDIYLADYTETRKFVYAAYEGIGDLYVKFYLPSGATRVFIIINEDDSGGAQNIIVSGAGTSDVNGTYVQDGTLNGKPKYKKADNVNLAITALNDNQGWILDDKSLMVSYYVSVNDVPTPDLATWETFEFGIGSLPAPTVTATGVEF